jgi:hypothetical protein
MKQLECCPTCHRPYEQPQDRKDKLVTEAIETYLISVESRPSYKAIKNRIKHVTRYLAMTNAAITCPQIGDPWIEAFRTWNAAQQIISPSGKARARTLSTVENSVLQLAAAMRFNKIQPQFKVIQPKDVNQTPLYRADIPTIARAFRYCVYAEDETRSDKWRLRRIAERDQLLRFLRVSICTLARPDAAHEVSTAAERRQWNSAAKVLNLNYTGRRQTKKYRAVVPIAQQFAPLLDGCSGLYVTVNGVGTAHDKMTRKLDLPGMGESGMKLWRRSMANILRSRLPVAAWDEISIFMGHDKFDDVSDLYAPFRPDYLRAALAEIESVIDEIEAACPGAFYPNFTARGENVVSIGAGRNG